jgi:hypothetical protein
MDEFLSFATSLQVWGAHWAGEASEQDAMLAEDRLNSLRFAWDRTRADLDTGQRWHGDRQVTIPDWWALTHLSTDEMERAFELEAV